MYCVWWGRLHYLCIVETFLVACSLIVVIFVLVLICSYWANICTRIFPIIYSSNPNLISITHHYQTSIIILKLLPKCCDKTKSTILIFNATCTNITARQSRTLYFLYSILRSCGAAWASLVTPTSARTSKELS